MYLSFLVAAFAITDPMVAKLRLPRSPADEAMRTTAVFGGYTYATSRPPLSTFDAMMAAKLGYKGDAPGGAAFDVSSDLRTVVLLEPGVPPPAGAAPARGLLAAYQDAPTGIEALSQHHGVAIGGGGIGGVGGGRERQSEIQGARPRKSLL